ncbi:MAG: FAD:protein FMN transferase [Desulfocapsaceae bacterium]|nr:FAD:protein FMN transferase [Desulfocapsaceae bacterium]
MNQRIPVCIKPMSTALMTIVAAAFCIACTSSSERIFKETRVSVYTVVTITVVSSSEDKAHKAILASFDELDRLATLLNFYSDTSEISAINRAAGEAPVRVSSETVDIMEKAVYVSEMTEGAFDVTVGPLVKLWDLKTEVIPDKAAIEEIQKIVGYKNIVIDKAASTVFLKQKGGQIDLGGIEKGYFVDKVVELLHKNGIKSGVVSVGGEIRAMGLKPDGSPWEIGVQNPRQKGPDDEVIATLTLSDKALSTSGDYVRFFEKNGVRYHHLLDPKTGYPSQQCGSTTIIADNNVTTDGFSKLFILGPEKGLAVAKKLGFDILYIDCKGKVVMSDGLKDKIKFTATEPPH